jgi:hypothetical protein
MAILSGDCVACEQGQPKEGIFSLLILQCGAADAIPHA